MKLGRKHTPPPPSSCVSLCRPRRTSRSYSLMTPNTLPSSSTTGTPDDRARTGKSGGVGGLLAAAAWGALGHARDLDFNPTPYVFLLPPEVFGTRKNLSSSSPSSRGKSVLHVGDVTSRCVVCRNERDGGAGETAATRGDVMASSKVPSVPSPQSWVCARVRVCGGGGYINI